VSYLVIKKRLNLFSSVPLARLPFYPFSGVSPSQKKRACARGIFFLLGKNSFRVPFRAASSMTAGGAAPGASFRWKIGARAFAKFPGKPPARLVRPTA